MTMKIRVAGVVKTVGKVSIKVAGVVKEVDRLMIKNTVSNLQGLREFYKRGASTAPAPPPPSPPNNPPVVVLGLSASPSSVSGRIKNGTGLVQTNTVTVTVSNGTAPYTCLWSMVSYDGENVPTAVTPTALATKFQKQLDSLDLAESAKFKCTVQDAAGNIGSISVDAYFSTPDLSGVGGTL